MTQNPSAFCDSIASVEHRLAIIVVFVTVNMSSWEYRHVTRECLLPYVDAKTAPPEVKEVK